VKSSIELKTTFAKVDDELAKAWHKNADETKKSSNDPSSALNEAGFWIEGSAKWSATQMKDGTGASVGAVKKLGKGTAKGAEAGAEDVNKWFKGIGEGIEDVGRKL
jgi:hypothetical protein